MTLAGVLPTPAVALLGEESGAVVSASHNPAEYNGVKFFSRGTKLTDDEEEAIEAELDAPPAPPPEGPWSSRRVLRTGTSTCSASASARSSRA